MRFNIGHRTAIFSMIGLALFALIGNANASNRITGTLTLMPQKIRLPDIDMVLRDAATQQEVAKSRTYLDGKFSLIAPKPGTYVACWQAPGIAGCTDRISVKAPTVYLGVVKASPEGRLISGKVLTLDKRACWVNDPFFKLDVSTHLSLMDRNGQVLRKDIRANVSGQYVIGGVKAGGYTVLAECEKANTQARVLVDTRNTVANLTLPNRAPRIGGLSVLDGAKGLSRAAVGATVKLQASIRDPDQDNIEYLWRTLDGYGTISGANAAQQDWKLPSKPGLYAVYLMARDGKGGYAYKRQSLSVGPNIVSFSGRVIDETTQAPVSGATVNVSGTTANTNAQGWFNVSVPGMASPERYVVNISHPQYAQMSRPYDKSVTGYTYELIRAQLSSHDPAQKISVVDTGSSGPCGAPGGKRAAIGDTVPRKFPAAHYKMLKREKACRHAGAQIVIPPGSLVDANKRAPQGPITMAMATLNPARRALPGDYLALDAKRAETELFSFGAVFAEFRDAAGKPLNLKPGANAEIRIPLSTSQRNQAKQNIAMWSYDEKSGLWMEEGQAALTNTPQGWMYIGKTKHFSTINMDVADNVASATCVRLQIGPSLNGWTGLTLRAYVPFGTLVQVKETALNADQYHVIYRIPYTAPAFPPTTLRMELRGTYNNQQVVLLDKVINTDAHETELRLTRPGPLTELRPLTPYEACGDAFVLELEADVDPLPYYGDDGAGRPAFLGGRGGDFLPSGGEDIARAYYLAIAGNTKTKLGGPEGWWKANQFGENDGSGGTRASYLNNNDLGFGRDMNCKKNGNDLACWVTNYGLPDQDLTNADAAKLPNLLKRGATVTMEYKSAAEADRRVTFYVYGGGDATAPRINFADLDGMGPKPVPHLCFVCHGGSPTLDTVTNEGLHARFREFDLPSFKYSETRSWDYGQAIDPTSQISLNATEISNFGTLNQMVRDSQPNTNAITALINAWYPDNVFNVSPIRPAEPAGWSNPLFPPGAASLSDAIPAFRVKNAYHNVFGKACRTCHVARDEGDTNPDKYILFNNAGNFSSTSYVVCDSPKVMPNAFVTYKNFWSDRQRVIDYRALTGTNATNCK